MEEEGAHIVALNCGTGMDMERARQALLRYKAVTGLPVMVQPNAGQPKLVNDAGGVRRDAANRWCAAWFRCSRPASICWAPAAAARPITSAPSARAMDEFAAAKGAQPMKSRLCDVNAAALEKLPEHTGDKCGIGVHYVDAYIKPMNLKLPDGTPVKCKRRGLKIVLSAGGKKGEGLLRRLALGPDPVVMLDAALQEAAQSAGVHLSVEDGAIYLDI